MHRDRWSSYHARRVRLPCNERPSNTAWFIIMEFAYQSCGEGEGEDEVRTGAGLGQGCRELESS